LFQLVVVLFKNRVFIPIVGVINSLYISFLFLYPKILLDRKW
jgi:hypothetical protein